MINQHLSDASFIYNPPDDDTTMINGLYSQSNPQMESLYVWGKPLWVQSDGKPVVVVAYLSKLSQNQTFLWCVSLCPHLGSTVSEIGKKKSCVHEWSDWSKHHLSLPYVPMWGRKNTLRAQFGSLFKLHTCADHKKRPVKALPGKPQLPVCFYKHTHIKYRERDAQIHVWLNYQSPYTTHTSLIILPCITAVISLWL